MNRMRHVDEIARDNDIIRKTMGATRRHRVVLTQAVADLASAQPDIYEFLIQRIKTFNAFEPANDPHGEHDFGCVYVGGRNYFWKIDYYDDNFLGSADPRRGKTALMLTIMRSDEY